MKRKIILLAWLLLIFTAFLLNYSISSQSKFVNAHNPSKNIQNNIDKKEVQAQGELMWESVSGYLLFFNQ